MYTFNLGDLTLYTASVEVLDLKSLIGRLRSNDEERSFFQPLRRGSIATPRHGFYIAYKSRKLRGKRIKRASVIAMLLSSGVTQIAKAYTKLSTEGKAQAVGVYLEKLEMPPYVRIIDDRPREEEIMRLHGSAEEKELIEKAVIASLELY